MRDFQTTPHCVYALIEDGRVVYVGCSLNPERRFAQHKAKGKCSKTAEMRIIRWYDGPRKARNAEAFYIRKLWPERNSHLKHLHHRKARAVWFSHPRMADRNILALMPGWTLFAAKLAFGSRGVYFLKQRKVNEAGRAAGFQAQWSKDALYRALGSRGVPAGPKMKQN